ncbi:hypothetical protein OSTOST_19727 [Ostertagia ostertagi]
MRHAFRMPFAPQQQLQPESRRMHTIARESLQHFLYAYKESPKEQGLRLVHDAKKSQALRREREYQRALQNLRAAVVNHI